MGFDASEQKHIEAWDALKAGDTYTADRTAVFFFMGFDASEQKHIEAWDAVKAGDTYTAFHFRMENSVGTLFFSASLFCCQEKPASCTAVKCPQPPHPAERILHVSFCPFFVAGTGRTVSIALQIFDFSRFIENLEVYDGF